MDTTAVFSGPLAQRGVVLGDFERAGAVLEPSLAQRGEPYGLPDTDPSVGWVAARGSLEDLRAIASRAGWALRLHWRTPDCRACGGTGRVNGSSGLVPCDHCEGLAKTNRPLPSAEERLAAQVEALNARLAALEARS